ncbi:hypothetical protein BH11PLA1_BH11PLA1_14520 [soil metagenome]
MGNRETHLACAGRGLVLPRVSHPLVRAVASRWRLLTSPTADGRRGKGASLLVACSAGADSSALAIALRAAGAEMVLGHVMHDLRGRAAVEADRDAALELARRLGVECDIAEVSVRERAGNAEAEARRLRYGALARLAEARGVRFIATAHHAHDQLETLLMTMLRGGGVSGMAGVRAVRRLGPGLHVIRPMLDGGPVEARELCRDAGWVWREDGTNADREGGGLRSALRARVVPELLRLRPRGALGAVRTAAAVADAATAVERAASELTGRVEIGATSAHGERVRMFQRRGLRACGPHEVRLWVRQVAGAAKARQATRTQVEGAARVIRSARGEEKNLQVGGVTMVVRGDVVEVRW